MAPPQFVRPPQSIRPGIYDVPGTPDAAPRRLCSADQATVPLTSSTRSSDTLTRSLLSGFRTSSVESGLDTRKRKAGIPDVSSNSKRNRQAAKAASASPSPSYRSGSTSTSDTIPRPSTTGGKQTAHRPPAPSLSRTDLQPLIKAALPSDYPGLSSEDVSLRIVGKDYERLGEDEYNKFKTRVRQGLGDLFQENKISRQRARGPNGGPAYEYVSMQTDQIQSAGSARAGAVEGSLARAEMTKAMSGSQAFPSMLRATPPDPVHDSNIVEVLPQKLSDEATTEFQQSEVAAKGGSVAEGHEKRDSRGATTGTEDTDTAIMELGKQVKQARMLNAQSKEAVKRVSDLKTQQQAAQDSYTALESNAHEEEVRTEELVAEAKKLLQQASEAEGRAAELRKQSVRSKEEARREREHYRDREEVIVKAENEALEIKEKLQEVKRALGID
ncbi:hypothetical protein LTR56_023585 [Elasticomyces elasticus]|nr:hypothetical protein LTR56_023585 [Elasticomyces elasticus]KAK3624110.1 hypothetical protein LTR22_024125 [Elasticomyces elasticus]KAK4908634.1 hypothetical protein LTR49_022498 [Elasticomyces elasticus]